MKIAILGTRGIPNNYGGPETNAEMLAPIFKSLGHEVTVYSPDEHPMKEAVWQGIHVRHVFNKESVLGTWGTLLYDLLCLRDAFRSDFDIILELGYVPCGIFYPFYLSGRNRRRPKVITNMDGLEWRRSKWNALLQRFAELTERLGARYSDAMIADNEAIRQYLLDKFGRDSRFIPYGAEVLGHLDEGLLAPYGVMRRGYFMLIARMEPENNIEMILDGYLQSGDSRPFLVVGKTTTAHGRYLTDKYASVPSVRFLGGIYDYAVLSALRGYAEIYFHGHSVGGTNPSLVEAMASGAFVVAHDNPFNRSVLEGSAGYFKTANDVANLVASDAEAERIAYVQANRKKVSSEYGWERIARAHIRLFEEVLSASDATALRGREFVRSKEAHGRGKQEWE